MAWFWPIIQLLIRLSASFSSYDIKMLHGIWYKLEDWMKRYLIQTYHRLSQEYFKSYRIAFRVALWLDFEQLSSYLFVYRWLCGVAVWKYYMELNTKLKDWIKTYLIISRSFQVIQNSFQGGLMACFLIVIQLLNRPYVFGSNEDKTLADIQRYVMYWHTNDLFLK